MKSARKTLTLLEVGRIQLHTGHCTSFDAHRRRGSASYAIKGCTDIIDRGSSGVGAENRRHE